MEIAHGLTHFSNSRASSRQEQSVLAYASPVWSPYTKQNIYLLESVLRWGARWACGSCFDSSTYHWSSSAIECCDRLKWHSLVTHRDITCLLLAHDIIHNNSCPLHHKLSVSSRSDQLQCQPSSINAFRYSYFVNVPFIWNKLDCTMRSTVQITHNLNDPRVSHACDTHRANAKTRVA